MFSQGLKRMRPYRSANTVFHCIHAKLYRLGIAPTAWVPSIIGAELGVPFRDGLLFESVGCGGGSDDGCAFRGRQGGLPGRAMRNLSFLGKADSV